MSKIIIKNITLGEGHPKICVPLTDIDAAGLKCSLSAMHDKPFDLVEWRADKFATLCDEPSLIGASQLIHTAFPDKPLIFTIRTNRDMEDFEISDEGYIKLVMFGAEHTLGDIIDIEFSRGAELVSKLIDDIRALNNDIKVIVSKHLRNSTPCESDIFDTLTAMQATGSDIVKYAAMPQSTDDVKALLDATYSYARKPDSVPVITMSMGKLGVISRISGSLTGSCLTFGTAGAASAPGQIDCEELSHLLDILA